MVVKVKAKSLKSCLAEQIVDPEFNTACKYENGKILGKYQTDRTPFTGKTWEFNNQVVAKSL